ncbi:N,N-dimethylformamidase beta subunit family domain-containing protein [Actinomadura rudentiformis]|uniref:N,N-dimethylformamidase beta subunit family domain-containing protein n=1 Tax=Actinomadura rudentiformis TaxID=359158 RepID=UPI001CEF90C2|nr:N,N-dimethylformamidase beta subunit family domain-containing protein [Actinomadura rudentiformis]
MRVLRGITNWTVLAVLPVLLLAACAFGSDDGGRRGGGAGGGGSARPGVAASPKVTDTVAENARPGTPDWRLRKRGRADEIEGYADRVSVLPGESFRLFVSTTTKGFKAEAFRVGWYGGAQARKLWESPRQPGVRQAYPKVSNQNYTVTAPWKPSLTVTTTDWPEGVYLLRLTADSGAQRYVPLTLRSRDATGRLVILNATTTWQAYNMWGGHNLYNGPSGYSDRSRAVSFDRPYDKDGTGKFMGYEHPAIVLAEKTGKQLAYATDNDLHASPDVLKGARGLVTLGHDEYWSTNMRTNVTKARDSGVNVAFLGANAVNRHIRFGPTKLGPDRLVTCYKDSSEDPVAKTDPKESTQDWRLPPVPRPESDLIGIMYNCFPAAGSFTVRRPSSWLFRGTGVRKGTAFPGLIGPETDAINPIGPTPRPIEVLAHSPIDCGGIPKTADATYYTTKSGSGVVATGTMRWVCAMRGPKCGHGVTEAGRRFVTKATENLLVAMAAGPLGNAYPVKDNLREFTGS